MLKFAGFCGLLCVMFVMNVYFVGVLCVYRLMFKNYAVGFFSGSSCTNKMTKLETTSVFRDTCLVVCYIYSNK